jgi:hypothetical protein
MLRKVIVLIINKMEIIYFLLQKRKKSVSHVLIGRKSGGKKNWSDGAL